VITYGAAGSCALASEHLKPKELEVNLPVMCAKERGGATTKLSVSSHEQRLLNEHHASRAMRPTRFRGSSLDIREE
jgi:hypothetical protein